MNISFVYRQNTLILRINYLQFSCVFLSDFSITRGKEEKIAYDFGDTSNTMPQSRKIWLKIEVSKSWSFLSKVSCQHFTAYLPVKILCI